MMMKRMASAPLALVALGVLLLGGCAGRSTMAPALSPTAASQGQPALTAAGATE